MTSRLMTGDDNDLMDQATHGVIFLGDKALRRSQIVGKKKNRKDGGMTSYSQYYNPSALENSVASGRHREAIGGLWDEMGKLQLDMMVGYGLRRDHLLLDIGCGSFRGGVQFAAYLEPDRYYGMDLSRELIDAGYEKELVPLGLDRKVKRENLLDDSNFDFERFGVSFDRAIAISVFTHLPLDLARVCLERLAPVMKSGGMFFATFFECPQNEPTHKPIHHKMGITTHAGHDPFHHKRDDFFYLCTGLPWQPVYVGDFNHPRGQHLMQFVRT